MSDPEAALDAERSRAEALVRDLNTELAAIAESTAGIPDDEHDAEGSTVGYERARVTALLTRTRATLAALEAASERVAAGTYRRCVRCGAEIPPERLEALAATQICLPCAVADRGSRQARH
jgi:DnaK suppressor protein